MRAASPDVVRRHRQLDDTRLLRARAATATTFFPATPAATAGAWWNGISEIPVHTMDLAGGGGPGHIANHLAGRAGDDEPYRLRGPRQVIRERRALGGILRGEEVMVHVRHVFPVQLQGDRRHREEVRAFFRDGRRPLADRRRIVEYPDPAPVGSQHQVFHPRMHQDVVVTRRRQVGGQPVPVRAAVVRHEQRPLGACEEQVRFAGILGKAPYGRVIGRQSAGHRCPRLAEICRAEDVRPEVAIAMGVE